MRAGRGEDARLQGWWAASYVVLWLLVIALCVLVVALARQVGTLHLRLGPRGALEIDDEGPPLGQPLEPVDAADVAGTPVSIGRPGRSQVLLFVSPGCRMCAEVLPGLAAVAQRAGAQPLVVTDADREESELSYRDRQRVPVVPGADIARRFGIPGTPYVLVVDPAGVVRAKGTVNNLEQMEGLVDTARRRLDQVG